MRPKTKYELYEEGKIDWKDLPQAPHCDSRILHLPDECEYCAGAAELQKEREQLGISNTGHANRDWPCPAERKRALSNMHRWHGNSPKKKGEASIFQKTIAEAYDIDD